MKIESFDNKTGLESQMNKSSLENLSKQFDNAAVNLKGGVDKFELSHNSNISKWLGLEGKGIDRLDSIQLRTV